MGVSLGPAVGGLLADTCGLRAPFMAVSAASAASALYATLRLPRDAPRDPQTESGSSSSRTRGGAGGRAGSWRCQPMDLREPVRRR